MNIVVLIPTLLSIYYKYDLACSQCEYDSKNLYAVWLLDDLCYSGNSVWFRYGPCPPSSDYISVSGGVQIQNRLVASFNSTATKTLLFPGMQEAGGDCLTDGTYFFNKTGAYNTSNVFKGLEIRWFPTNRTDFDYKIAKTPFNVAGGQMFAETKFGCDGIAIAGYSHVWCNFGDIDDLKQKVDQRFDDFTNTLEYQRTQDQKQLATLEEIQANLTDLQKSLLGSFKGVKTSLNEAKSGYSQVGSWGESLAQTLRSNFMTVESNAMEFSFTETSLNVALDVEQTAFEIASWSLLSKNCQLPQESGLVVTAAARAIVNTSYDVAGLKVGLQSLVEFSSNVSNHLYLLTKTVSLQNDETKGILRFTENFTEENFNNLKGLSNITKESFDDVIDAIKGSSKTAIDWLNVAAGASLLAGGVLALCMKRNSDLIIAIAIIVTGGIIVVAALLNFIKSFKFW